MLGLYRPLWILNSHKTDDFETRCVCLVLDAKRTISNLTNYDNDECTDVIMEIPNRISSIKLTILSKIILKALHKFPEHSVKRFLFIFNFRFEGKPSLIQYLSEIDNSVGLRHFSPFLKPETAIRFTRKYDLTLFYDRTDYNKRKKNNSITNIWTNTILVSTSVRLYIWILWYSIQKAKIHEKFELNCSMK